jgi:hypothetical protein
LEREKGISVQLEDSLTEPLAGSNRSAANAPAAMLKCLCLVFGNPGLQPFCNAVAREFDQRLVYCGKEGIGPATPQNWVADIFLRCDRTSDESFISDELALIDQLDCRFKKVGIAGR